MQAEMLDSVVSSDLQELSDASASSAIKLFENPQFRVRVIMRCADPWFVAKDACDCLDLGNVSQTCSRLDDDERGIISIDTPSGKQEMLIVSDVEELKTNDLLVSGNRGLTCISESGLYRILAKCNLPKCELVRGK